MDSELSQRRKKNVKIISDATVPKENKYGKSFCDIDTF